MTKLCAFVLATFSLSRVRRQPIEPTMMAYQGAVLDKAKVMISQERCNERGRSRPSGS